jgi:hypothetical protein
MHSCTFADNFINATMIGLNNGTIGSGITANYGATGTGAGRIAYDLLLQNSPFSVVIKFSTSTTASSDTPIIGNKSTTDTAAGFIIWVDADGVKANYADGADLSAECAVDLDYADGETHTITYTVEMSTGNQVLYVDGLTADTQTAVPSAQLGTNNVSVLGYSTDYFTGTVYKVRIFDAALTATDHANYHSDGHYRGFWSSPYAAYKCDSWNDDTDGNFIWDKGTNRYDLTKGDASTATTFPTFDTDHYEFDGTTDYVSTFPALPTAYTISVCRGGGTPWVYPYVQQDNDTSFSALITSAGSYEGWMYNLAMFNSALSQIQLNHVKYRQLYWIDRCWVTGHYNRLIAEGTCKLLHFFSKSGGERDWSDTLAAPSIKGVTYSASTGISFSNSDSGYTYAHDSDLATTELTIIAEGNFTGSEAAGVLVDKGTNYKLWTNGNNIYLNTSTISHVFSSNSQIAVTAKSGFKPRFYVDREYIGEGSTTVTLDSADTTALNIGNNNEENLVTAYSLLKLYIGNKALSNQEMVAIYDSRTVFGAENNMSKGYYQTTATGAAAIAFSIEPADDFDVPLITIKLSSAPTSAGSITVSLDAEAGANYDAVLATVNPIGKTSIVFEDLIGFQNGDKVLVEYANPDSRTYYATANYEL